MRKDLQRKVLLGILLGVAVMPIVFPEKEAQASSLAYGDESAHTIAGDVTVDEFVLGTRNYGYGILVGRPGGGSLTIAGNVKSTITSDGSKNGSTICLGAGIEEEGTGTATITINGNTDLHNQYYSDNGAVYGIILLKNGNINLNGTKNDILIDATGIQNVGISMINNDAPKTLNVTGELNIKVLNTYNSSYGITTKRGGVDGIINFNGPVTITAEQLKGNYTEGVLSGGTINFNNDLTINTTTKGTVTTTGVEAAHIINFKGNSKINITSSGENGNIWLLVADNPDGIIDIGNNVGMNIKGTADKGSVYGMEVHSGGTINIGDSNVGNVIFRSEENKAYGMYCLENSKIMVGNNNTLNIDSSSGGNNAYGYYGAYGDFTLGDASVLNLKTTGKSDAIGIFLGASATKSSILKAAESSSINIIAQGEKNVYGLRVYGIKGTGSLGNVDIKVTGGTDDAGIVASQGATIAVKGTTKIVSDQDALQANGSDSSNILINTGKQDVSVQLVGNVVSLGDGSHNIDAMFNTGDSFLTGASAVNGTGTDTIHLAFDNGSLWNVTGNSTLTDLDNNSTVNMRYAGNFTDETLTTANLKGSGTYAMNTDLQASKDSSNVTKNGDKIVITRASSGNNLLDLRDISLDTKLCSEGYLLLVEDQSKGAATFLGKDLDHGGIFRYRPIITTANPTDYTGYNANATNWYLTGFERLVEVSDNTNVTKALGDTRYANYLAHNDTLLKRLGELRMLKNQPAEDGFWARYRHGMNKTDMVDGKFTTFQLGYDKRTGNKRFTGIAFSHTDNKYDALGVGHGDGSQDALSVYNTWLGDKEHYFDIVAQVGKMRGDSTYEDILFPETGDYGVWFYSLSGEYGRKNKDKSGWYYEPQVQLTVGHINGDDYATSRDTKVSQDAINSVLLRTGVTVGKEFNMDKPEKRSNVYAKINWLHDFRGDTGLNMTDSYGDSASFTNELGGTYWNAGIGATLNLNKRTHLYVDFEKNFGGHVTSNWIGQAGCRWTW